LPGHPGGATSRRDARGCNGLFSVESTPGFALEPFLDHLQLFAICSSWGGFESLAMPVSPANGRQFETASAGPMARFHAGLEHISDLVADMTAAIDLCR
jgi:cysteine-S-conjugate beta-lyase